MLIPPPFFIADPTFRVGSIYWARKDIYSKSTCFSTMEKNHPSYAIWLQYIFEKKKDSFSKMSILPAYEVQRYQIVIFKRFYMGTTYIRFFSADTQTCVRSILWILSAFVNGMKFSDESRHIQDFYHHILRVKWFQKCNFLFLLLTGRYILI